MKKRIVGLIIIALLLVNCKNDKQDKTNPDTKKSTESKLEFQRGYELLKQKCLICHIETPDPSKAGQMLAPPLLRVQEHYKPNYPKKEDFVKAVVSIVTEPSEKNTLMPGAVKKFNLMPKVVYDKNELTLIAGALYEIDFGNVPKQMMKHRGSVLKLNNGKKWKLKPESVEKIDSLTKMLDSFTSDKVEDYNQLGKTLFNESKTIMLDKSYEGELFDQIHVFFQGIEGNMHFLMQVKTPEEGQKQVNQLKKKFKRFHNFFE